MLLQELLAFPVTEAEEYDIHFVERHLACEAQVCLAHQSLMYFTNGVPSIRLTIGKDNLRLRMPQQHTDKFTSRVTSRT